MDIEIRHTPDCPHLRWAEAVVAEALAATGVSARVSSRVVSSAAEAEHIGLLGSPTIYVDGRASGAEGVPGFACRLDAGGDAARAIAALVAAIEKSRLSGTPS